MLWLSFLLFTAGPGSAWLMGLLPFHRPPGDWARVTSIGEVRFQSIVASSGYGRTIWPFGPVRGTVSDPQLAVFLLIKIIPPPSLPHSDAQDSWGIAEATVDAEGNWEAGICYHPHIYIGEIPDFEYWEVLAVATRDAKLIREATVPELCAISSRDLRKIGSLTCSESRIVTRPPDSGGGYYMGRPPQPREDCFETSSVAAEPPNKPFGADGGQRASGTNRRVSFRPPQLNGVAFRR